MKLDKESLLKNRFWILAGTAVVLSLISLAILFITVPESAGKDQKDQEKNWKQAKNVSGEIKSPAAVEAMRKAAEEVKNSLGKVQSELYKSQDATGVLMWWPVTMTSLGYDLQHGKFAYEIEVQAKPPAKLPADTESVIYGNLNQFNQDWFEITDSKGKTVKFLRTMKPKIIDLAKNVTTQNNFGPLKDFLGRTLKVTFLT